METSLGSALLPLIALAASLVAAVSVGSLVVAWLRKPEPDQTAAITDPRTAGLLAVGFVSGEASRRWLPATVLELADAGIVAIHDRREIRDGDEGWPRDIHLVFDADSAMVGAAAEAGDPATAVVDSVFGPTQTGGSNLVSRGASIEIDQVLVRNRALAMLTRDRLLDAAGWYRERRPVARLRAATVGGVLGVGLGFVSLPGSGDDSIAWIAIVVGVLALGLRIFLPSWVPLNAAGLELRERSMRLREELDVWDPTRAGSAARSATLEGGVLPWAVLFDDASAIERAAEAAERSGTPPAWYRSSAPFSAGRLVSCIALVGAQLSQPIRLGPGRAVTPESRFGVPMVADHKGWGGAYFDGNGAGAVDGGLGGGGGFGGYDGNAGYDGGGFGGGAFDGGGFAGGGGGDGGGGN
ncbi:hypothetical protein ACFQ58_05005 [Agromyces sp. NPDC056523]|uniref:hypothetical protein n=1 Tax=Agromyces sp. NPDC056523 TaxID=3345850 RepID=UPI00366C2731